MLSEGAIWSAGTSDTLVDGLRDRDPEAWSRFVRLYAGGMNVWLRKKGLQEHDCCDVIQRVLLNVLVNIERFQRDAKARKAQLRPWLMAILKNVRIDLHRELGSDRGAASGDRRLGLLDELSTTMVMDAEFFPANPDGASSFWDGLLETVLAEARGRFPRRFEAFWLKYSENDLTFQEIGDKLGMSEHTARQAHYSVLRWLKQRLAELSEE